MLNSDRRYPALYQPGYSRPAHTSRLAPPSEHGLPHEDDRFTEGLQGMRVSWDSVILKMTTNDRTSPLTNQLLWKAGAKVMAIRF